MKLPVARLTKRADFVLLSRSPYKVVARTHVLQARVRTSDASPETIADGTTAIRIGFTVTKKLGGAVIRNRIRRRLKASASLVFPEAGRPGMDYVLIGRSVTETAAFDVLQKEMRQSLRYIQKLVDSGT